MSVYVGPTRHCFLWTATPSYQRLSKVADSSELLEYETIGSFGSSRLFLFRIATSTLSTGGALFFRDFLVKWVTAFTALLTNGLEELSRGFLHMQLFGGGGTRRCEDDARQISRGNGVMGPRGRWRTFLCKKCVNSGLPLEEAVDDYTTSPKVRQLLQHWGYTLTLKDLREKAKKI
eukprot:gene24182-30499_t